MVGMLPVGYSMLAEALNRGIQSDAELRQLAPASPPPTIQVKLAMSFSPDGLEAISVIRDSKGLFLSVSDEEARAAQLQLASCEGVYAELSGAVALVGAEKLISSRMVSPGQSIIAMITGSGFRETAQLAGLVAIERIPLDPKDGASRLKDLLSA
jgi:threonine synthase